MATPALAQNSTATPDKAAPAFTPPAGLEMAPADASAVLFVPSLSKLSMRMANFNDAMGLEMEQLADPLLGFKQALNITKGFNDDGSAMLVVSGGEGEPSVVALLPSSDYAALVSSFGGDPAAPVASITTLDGHTGFARKVGAFALVGSKREAVENYRPANAANVLIGAAGKYGSQIFATSDVTLYLNVPVLAARIRAQTEAMQSAAKSAMGANKGSAKETSDAVGTLMNAGAAAIGRDATAMVIGMDISETGVGISTAIQFKTGTPLATQFANAGDASPLFNRAPGGTYIMASALNLQGLAISQWAKDVISLIPPDSNSPEFAGLRRSLSLLEKSKSVTQVMYLPPPGTIGATYNGLSIVEVSDPKAYLAAFKDSVTSMDNEKTAKGNVKVSTSYTLNALQIDGISVDQYSIRYTSSSENDPNAGQGAAFMSMLGGSGQTGYVVANGNFIVTTTTPDTQLVRSAFAALKQDGGFNSTVSSVRANLPPKSCFETYIHFGGIAAALKQTLEINKLPPLLPVPADLPPVGIGLSVQNSAVGGRIYVPMVSMRYVRDNIRSMMPALQQHPEATAGHGGAAQPTPAPTRTEPRPSPRPGPGVSDDGGPRNRPGGGGG